MSETTNGRVPDRERVIQAVRLLTDLMGDLPTAGSTWRGISERVASGAAAREDPETILYKISSFLRR